MTQLGPVFTKGRQHGARLNILLCDVATSVCRHIFHHDLGFPEDPHDLYVHLSVNGIRRRLNNLKKPPGRVAILSEREWAVLFPTNQRTESNAFDITLFIVLFRTICRIPPPSMGWSRPPANTDTSLAADLVRLRIKRNDYRAHLPNTSLSNAEFENQWNEVEAILLRLGGSQMEIDNVKNSPLDPSLLKTAEQNLLKLVETEKELDSYKADCEELKEKYDQIKERIEKDMKPQLADVTSGLKTIESKIEELQCSVCPITYTKKVKYSTTATENSDSNADLAEVTYQIFKEIKQLRQEVNEIKQGQSKEPQSEQLPSRSISASVLDVTMTTLREGAQCKISGNQSFPNTVKDQTKSFLGVKRSTSWPADHIDNVERIKFTVKDYDDETQRVLFELIHLCWQKKSVKALEIEWDW